MLATEQLQREKNSLQYENEFLTSGNLQDWQIKETKSLIEDHKTKIKELEAHINLYNL